jgi:outer membrane receptor protein involved in Fe transport
VVRVVPAAPDLHDFEVQVGTREFATAHSGDPSYHVEGTMNIPVLEDRLGLRLVAYKDNIAGYIDNIVPARGPRDYSFLADALLGLPGGTTPPGTLVIPGNQAFTRQDINSEDTWGARAALTWRATDRLHFDLNYATQEVTLHSEPQVQPAAGPYAQDREVDLYDRGRLFEHVNIGSLVAHYDWDAVSLLSATGTMNMSRGRVIDESFFAEGALGVPLPWTLHDDSRGRVFTEELRLQSKGQHALQWTLGAFYLYQDADASQFLPDFSCPTCLPTLFLGQDFELRPAPDFDSKVLRQTQRSLFGEVSYTMSRWTLGIGARYLEDSIETVSGAYEGFIVNGFLPATPPISGTNYEFNPSGYLRFKATDDVMLYMQVARGFRSGQVNQVLAYTGPCAQEAAAIGLGPLTRPDTLWNHELGLKSRFMDERINVNVALYQQKWDGVQLGTSLSCGFNGTINAGNVQGKGAELEITAQLLRGLKLNLSASYNHNEFDSVVPSTGFAKGERVPDAPEENAGVGLQYDFPVNNVWSGFARADYTFVGDVQYKFGQGDSAIIIKQPSYGSANLRLGLHRGDFTIELFARNFTDRRAAVFTADPDLGNYQYLLRPREVGGEIRYSFEPTH